MASEKEDRDREPSITTRQHTSTWLKITKIGVQEYGNAEKITKSIRKIPGMGGKGAGGADP